MVGINDHAMNFMTTQRFWGRDQDLENGFMGSGGRDLNFFPRAMPVSTARCSSSDGASGKAVLSFFIRATPG